MPTPSQSSSAASSAEVQAVAGDAAVFAAAQARIVAQARARGTPMAPDELGRHELLEGLKLDAQREADLRKRAEARRIGQWLEARRIGLWLARRGRR